MAQKPIVISNTRKGLERDVEAFLIPQDAYPNLEDVYMFRGRIQRRRGLSRLGQLVRAVVGEAKGNTASATFAATLTNTVISPGSAVITIAAPQSEVFTDNGLGVFVGSVGGSGTINYYTGAISVTVLVFAGISAVSASYEYYSVLPCMGLRSRELTTINEEQLIGFDTVKANAFFSSATPPRFEDISFYKSNAVAFSWTGTDAQFFWSVNYQNAFFATNAKPGAHFFVITNINDNATATITFTGGDVFVNGDVIAVTNVVATNAQVVNGFMGTVSAHGAGTITVNINTVATALGYASGGILYSLTRTQSGDGIRWYDGTGWVNFQPPLSASATGTNVSILQGCLILVAYKGRLLALNTTEGVSSGAATNYMQRCRFSEVGTVFFNQLVPSGFTGGSQSTAWRSDIPGRGGFIDAPTSEQIISAEFIKDTLVVFFERSTYQLRYTGDPTIPFIWEKINTELGGESTFSVVPFDNGVFAIGNYGVVTCNSVNVERIDQMIPDEVFNIHNANDGVKRVQGIRDYFKQLVYWTFPNDFTNDQDIINKFPTRILVYNYLDGSFSFFNDSITAFGQYQAFNDLRWKDVKVPWASFPNPWNTGQFQQDFPKIVGGNQQGFVFYFNQDQVINDPSLMISGASQATVCTLTVTNHNLQVDQFIKVTSVNGMTQLNNLTVTGSSGSPYGIYQVIDVVNANSFKIGYVETLSTSPNYGDVVPVDSTAFSAYTNGGLIAVINNFNIITKQFNPFEEAGLQARLSYVDLFLEAATQGQFTLNYYLNQNDDSVDFSTTCSAVESSGQEKIWVRNIPNITAQYVQIEVTFSELQMADPTKYAFDFVLHAMSLYFDPASRFMFGTQL